ncbi:MAG: hypothetical protein ABWY20_15865 [Mycobacterium sp.]
MRGTQAACQELLDQLVAGGFAGSALDPAELDPSPGAVWVVPQFIHDVRLDGSAELTVWLYLIVRQNEFLHDWTLLDDALAGLLELLDDPLALPLADESQPIDLRAAVLLPGHETPSPAYRVAVDLEL